MADTEKECITSAKQVFQFLKETKIVQDKSESRTSAAHGVGRKRTDGSAWPATVESPFPGVDRDGHACTPDSKSSIRPSASLQQQYLQQQPQNLSGRYQMRQPATATSPTQEKQQPEDTQDLEASDETSPLSAVESLMTCTSDEEWVPSGNESSFNDFDNSSDIVFGSCSDTDDTDASVEYPARWYKCPVVHVDNSDVREESVQMEHNESSGQEKGNVEDSTEGKQEGKKCGSKKHCCKFCFKLNSKMSTHLIRCHALEPEVAQILNISKGDPVLRKEFIRIQDEGEFHYNCKVLKEKEGNLIPKYRRKAGTAQDTAYRACPHCKAIYRKYLLSRHEPRCKQKTENGQQMRRGQCALIGRMLLPLPQGVTSSFFEKVLSKLKNDEIGRIVMADSLIVKYGERLFTRRDCEEHTFGQINGRLRELGRLCHLLRSKSKMHVSSLTQAIDPANFDLLVASVRELGEFSQSTNMCGKGSLVMKLGYSLKKCSHIIKAEAIKCNDTETRDKCERFEALYAGDWCDVVSACASQSVQRARMNKPRLLPSVADVEKVNELLKKDFQSESYVTLAKAALASITIFNRKRGGEVQRMKCCDYQLSKTVRNNPSEEELLADLSVTEKKLVNILHRVEIRGKFNRPVPILMTPTMVNTVEKLLVQRKLLGIVSEYLFLTPTGQRPYRGSAVLQKYATAANVSDAALFTATTLRKQLATLSQAMAISEFNQDLLASFLGHVLRIHRSIYRQSLDVVQKTKVASILLKVNRGIELTVTDVDADEFIETEDGSQNEESTSDDDADNEKGEKFEDLQTHSPQALVSNDDQSTFQQPKDMLTPRYKKKSVKKPWTLDEANTVRKHLSFCLVMNRVPQKHECEQVLLAEPILRNRKWTDIKFFIYNILKKQR